MFLVFWFTVFPDVSAGMVVDSTLIFLQGTTFNRMLDQAIDYQKRADCLERLAIEQRKEAAKMDDPQQRGKLQKQIIQVEDSVKIYTRLANEHFQYLDASIPEKSKPEPKRPFLLKDTVLNGITVYKYNLNEEFISLLAKASSPVITVIAGFKNYDASLYGTAKPFEQNYAIPPGVFYRIQLAVYSKQPEADHFGGLSPITTEAIPERGLTRYYVGKFTHMEEANRALVKVRSMGYPDAFIIGYYDGQRSSFNKLKALEK